MAGGAAHGDADLVWPAGPDRPSALAQDDPAILERGAVADRRAGATLNQDRRAPPRGALRQARVVGVDDQPAAMAQGLSHDELGVGDAVEVDDAVFTQMIGRDVGDQARWRG